MDDLEGEVIGEEVHKCGLGEDILSADPDDEDAFLLFFTVIAAISLIAAILLAYSPTKKISFLFHVNLQIFSNAASLMIYCPPRDKRPPAPNALAHAPMELQIFHLCRRKSAKKVDNNPKSCYNCHEVYDNDAKTKKRTIDKNRRKA